MTVQTTRVRMLVAGREIDAGLVGAVASKVGCAPIEWAAAGGSATPWKKQEHALTLLVVVIGNGASGRARLAALRAGPPRMPCLILLAEDVEADLVREAAELGDDFIVGRARDTELEQRLRRLDGAGSSGRGGGDEVASASRRLRRHLLLGQLVGEAPAFRRMVDMLPRLAAREGTVLITGETGTGKELCARAIHHLGARAGRPFVAVDCGALPDHLLENELFGHARGAYTDARSEQRGLVGMADGGVLFLDEVDALSLPAQAKLLRFLQEHCYRPLGGERWIEADVRIIAATNADLGAAIRTGKLRSDLYFRLNVLQVRTVPLRDRRQDIALLAEHFVRAWDREGGARGGPAREPRRLSAGALRALERHSWPGNVRELENVILRALAASAPDASEIEASSIELGDSLESEAREPVSDEGSDEAPVRDESFRAAKQRAIADFERRFVGRLLQRHNGNITQAARAASKDRRALGRLVKKYLPGRL